MKRALTILFCVIGIISSAGVGTLLAIHVSDLGEPTAAVCVHEEDWFAAGTTSE